MASSIDPTKPIESDNSVSPPVHPTTQSVRDNFQAAANDIEALQVEKNLLGSTNGNIIRKFRLSFTKGAGGGLVCAVEHASGVGFNVAATVDVSDSAEIAKSGSDTVGSGATAITYSLNSTGAIVTVDLAEAVTSILAAAVALNSSGTAVNANVSIASGNLNLFITNAATGAAFDLLTMTTGELVVIDCLFVVGGAA